MISRQQKGFRFGFIIGAILSNVAIILSLLNNTPFHFLSSMAMTFCMIILLTILGFIIGSIAEVHKTDKALAKRVASAFLIRLTITVILAAYISA